MPLYLLLLSLLLCHHPQISARPNPLSVNRWRSFDHLLDSEPGSEITGISDLKRYLHRFGYLPSPSANFTDSFDPSLESAVADYQSSLGLTITRRLDAPTLAQIISPRCGVGDGAGVVRRFAFFSGKPRWSRSIPMTLTYALSPSAGIDYVQPSDVTAVLRRAFDRWAGVIPVRFAEAEEYESADVKVGFYGGDHGDGEAFDGVLGVLAHAFSPESGRLHLDSAERWAVDFGQEESPVAVDLESVVTHEIGHVLGLAHSSVREAVMYPSLSPRTRKADLRADDVEGVQSLYGSNPDFSFSSLLESDMSAAGRGAVGWVILRVCSILILALCI